MSFPYSVTVVDRSSPSIEIFYIRITVKEASDSNIDVLVAKVGPIIIE